MTTKKIFVKPKVEGQLVPLPPGERTQDKPFLEPQGEAREPNAWWDRRELFGEVEISEPPPEPAPAPPAVISPPPAVAAAPTNSSAKGGDK